MEKEEFMKYKDLVRTTRIDAIYNLISEFNSWSRLSEEEGNQLDKIIEDLKNYVNLLLLNKINKELKNYLEYLERE